MDLSRFDGKLDPAGEALIGPDELLASLRARAGRPGCERQEAITRSLSASEGWKEALGLLGGAFAPDIAVTKVKDD